MEAVLQSNLPWCSFLLIVLHPLLESMLHQRVNVTLISFFSPKLPRLCGFVLHISRVSIDHVVIGYLLHDRSRCQRLARRMTCHVPVRSVSCYDGLLAILRCRVSRSIARDNIFACMYHLIA